MPNYIEISASSFLNLVTALITWFMENDLNDDNIDDYVVRFNDCECEFCRKDEESRIKAV